MSSSTAKKLVIVESPAKARTIKKYLGPNYVVESSIGHIRDLPSKAAEIPKQHKDKPWARIAVDVENDFEPLYIVPADKKAQVKKLRDLLRDAAELYLATDEDREGEAIAWHLFEVLKPKVPVRRMVFEEITKRAISRAVERTREIDKQLVDAQETRRILDRLFGYEVSPVLWKKIAPRLSAGRVQSVATRLVVERERARMAFRSAEYWDLAALLATRGEDAASGATTLDARLEELGGRRLATGKSFDDETGELKDPSKFLQLGEKDARRLAERLAKETFRVAEVAEKPYTSRPYAPFITATLQQEAGRKLRFSAQRTMRVAQSLYENGYITYMRTDSTTLSREAIEAARAQVRELYGADYLPDAPRSYTGRSKNAQEAHEAIRPAGERFRTPQELAGELDADQRRLYDLIWKRTVASQMKDARGQTTSVKIAAQGGDLGEALFKATGKVITFPGYLRAYVEGSDDPQAELEDRERVLPRVVEGEELDPRKVEAERHETTPPARYTEASLVRELEQRGIGRPSTYASILETIKDRGYVNLRGSALVPTLTAFAVTQLMERYLPKLVDYDFTAQLEEFLDRIADGALDPVPFLRHFYFGGDEDAAEGGAKGEGDLTDVGLKILVDESGAEIDAREVASVPIGTNDKGELLVARVGRYGPYVQLGDTDKRATIPEDLPPDELTVERALEFLEQAEQSDRVLGTDPETGKEVFIKSGRFGPYVQLGEPELTDKGTVKRGGKPKMASLWPGMSMETITLDEALKLLSFPRVVGTHPESGEEITAQDGRYGPYIKMGSDSRSLPNHGALETVTLDEAVRIFKEPRRRRGQGGQAALKELGERPEVGGKVQVKAGRFGPYVTDGVVNASLPKGQDPEQVDMDRALELLRAREEKLRAQGKDPRAPKAAKARGRKAGTRKAASSRKTTTRKKTSKKS